MRERLLREFFYYPLKQFGVRELARTVNASPTTVLKYLRQMIGEGVIRRMKKRGNFAHYETNRLSSAYRLLKSTALLERIAMSGLIDYLEKELHPKAIVLFGSVQKGTYLRGSDIDIFILGKEKHPDLSTYEGKLGHEIQLLFAERLEDLHAALRGAILSGYTLQGRLDR